MEKECFLSALKVLVLSREESFDPENDWEVIQGRLGWMSPNLATCEILWDLFWSGLLEREEVEIMLK